MDSLRPLVSVLMPCYQAAGTLPEAIASLSSQSFTQFEVVAVDDGSQDDTLNLLQAWAARDRRVRIISQRHAGILHALNTGLDACQAELVARMDTDDLSSPDRLQRQVEHLLAFPDLDVVACQVEGFPTGQVRTGFRLYMDWLNSLLTDDDIRREMFVESPLAHPSVLFRKSAVASVGGYQEHGWAEDYDLWLRMYLAGSRFAKLPEILLFWREHPERLTRTDSRYSLENFLRAKAYYLLQGPLLGREAVFIWGAGMMGRRLGRQLLRLGVKLTAYFDIDPRKIGSTRHGLPILSPQDLPGWWGRCRRPVLLAAVGSRNARPIIRSRLTGMGLQEAKDWWFAA